MSLDGVAIHALLALSLFLGAASAQYCIGPDTAGRVSCTISGPAEGVFLFPDGVATFTLDYLSSGNGGQAFYPNSGSLVRDGGFGAQTTGAVTLNTLPSGLRYIVGGNGVSVNGEYGDYRTRALVQGPPRTGDGNNAGSGGGPSWLPDYQISLGGGGGSAYCGRGGSAIADDSFSNGFWAGENGHNDRGCRFDGTVAASAALLGGGAPAALGAAGSAGHLGSESGQLGQPDGSGGNAAYLPSGRPSAGGGGGMTGAGGGGAVYASGGAGNSQAGSGVTLQRRSDKDTPVLHFSYTVTTFSVTSREIATVTSTLPTVTTTLTALTTSTAFDVTASQLPLSTSVLTIPITDVSVFTARRTKARAFQTVTVTADLSTSVAQATMTGPATCEVPAAVYSSACCPALWIAMQAYSAASKRSLNARKLVSLQRRTGSTMLSSTVLGLGNPTLSFTTVATSTVLSTVPDVEMTATSTVVVTSTSISTVKADTITTTAFSRTTEIITAVPGTTLTVKAPKTVSGPVTTVTSTTTVPSRVCRLNTVYTASQCTFSRGGVDPAYKKRAAYELQTLKKQNGNRQIAVDCGSAGVFLY